MKKIINRKNAAAVACAAMMIISNFSLSLKNTISS